MDSLISAQVSGTASLECPPSNTENTLQNINGFLLVVGRNGIVRFASSTVEKHLDFTSSEMVGTPIFDFLSSDDHPAMNTALTCLNNNYPIIFPKIFECWMCCKGHPSSSFYYRRVIMHVAPLWSKPSAAPGTESTESNADLTKYVDKVALGCVAKASKLSLSPQPRSSFGFGRFTTLISFPETTVIQMNAIDIDIPCNIDISVGDNFIDYVHEADRQELRQYFSLVSLTGASPQPPPRSPLTISSFYRIQISRPSGEEQRCRLALVQSSSRFISTDTTRDQTFSEVSSATIILATHTIIRLVDGYEASSSENTAMEHANICSLVEQSVNESKVLVTNPGTNESSKENKQFSPTMNKPSSVDNQPTQIQRIASDFDSAGSKSPGETALRRSRSHRLLQLLTCGRTTDSEPTEEHNVVEENKPTAAGILDLTSLESACGLVLTQSSYYDHQNAQQQQTTQKARKRSQQQNKAAPSTITAGYSDKTSATNLRAGQMGKTKKGRKSQLASSTASSTTEAAPAPQSSWTPTASFDSVATSAQRLMGIEETTTLSRNLFDQEKDCSGVLTEEELLAIREDPEEREQIIRFVLEASSSCLRPLTDDFIDLVKSELVKAFHEVALSPAWYRRESVWMNHALQLAKQHFNRKMDEQRIVLQQRSAYCMSKVPNDSRLSPYATGQMVVAGDFGGQDSNDVQMQQLWMMQQRQRRSMECSPTAVPYVEYESGPRAAVDYMYGSPGQQRCPFVVAPIRQYNQPVNEFMYQPRQMMVSGDAWQRQCVPVDRRRMYYDTNGMMSVPVFPVRNMSRDSRLMMDGAVAMSECQHATAAGMTSVHAMGRCRVPDGVYVNAAQHGYGVPNSVYCNSTPSTPMRVTPDCEQMASHPQQRYRLIDSTGFAGFAGPPMQDPNEFARYRQIPLQGGELVQTASPVQVMPAGGHSAIE